MKTVEHWIGGASTPGSSTRTADVYNPATGQVQARIMFAFRELIERHLDDIARVVSAEHGKVISDAKGEVIRGCSSTRTPTAT